MRGVLIAALLWGLAAQAQTQLKLASPGLSYAGVDPAIGDAMIDRFVTVLGEQGRFKMTTAKDIAQVVGLERQKQLMGCNDSASASCLAELAGALGVDAILTGSLAKIGASYTVTLRVVKSADGSQVAAASTRVKNEEELQDWLEAQAKALAPVIRSTLAPESVPPPAVSTSSGRSKLPVIPAGVGAAVIIGGVVSSFLAGQEAAALRLGTAMDIDATASRGATLQTAGAGMIIGGAVLAAVALVWFLLFAGPPS